MNRDEQQNPVKSLQTKIEILLNECPIPIGKILKEIAFASRQPDPSDLPILKRIASNKLGNENIAIPVMAFLPAWGLKGIKLLIQQAFNGPYRPEALTILAVVARGNHPTARNVITIKPEWDKLFDYAVTEDLRHKCLRMIRAGILKRIAEPSEKSSLMFSMTILEMFSGKIEAYAGYFDFYADLLIDSHLALNESIFQQFESLLESTPEKEEYLQKFLTKHPALLDPFVTELWPKHRLGSDYITDYVIRRINNEYILIEIENSTRNIFTRSGAFTNSLTKAVSQVRDFQAWIADNLAYAQKMLPGIRRPDGLVVIGRSHEFNEANAKRLDEENFSRRGHIRILTYDDLLNQAKAVHRNLINRR